MADTSSLVGRRILVVEDEMMIAMLVEDMLAELGCSVVGPAHALDTALVSATSGRTFDESRQDSEYWGRLMETAVGAHLCATRDPRAEILYWRDRNKEVDFVIQRGEQLTALEVKSGRRRDGLPGMAAFEAAHGPARKLLVGGDGTALDDFLADG